jgi:hypothetical protein
MHFPTTLLLSFSLALATGALADSDSHQGLREKPVKTSKRAVSSLLETRQSCQGTCQTCFGATFKDCPNSNYYCWDPALGSSDSQCSGGSSPSSPSPSASPGETTDTCFQAGATCESCFGTGSTKCPAGSYYDCYQPSQYSQSEGCSLGDGSSSSGIVLGSSATAAFSPSRTSSGILNTGTAAVFGNSASADSPSSSSVSRVTRTPVSTRESTDTATGTATRATGSAAASTANAAATLLEKDAGAFAALAAGFLALMGLL